MATPEAGWWQRWRRALAEAGAPVLAERVEALAGGRPDVDYLCSGCGMVARVELKVARGPAEPPADPRHPPGHPRTPPAWPAIPWASPAQPAHLRRWWRHGGWGGVWLGLASHRGTTNTGWWYGPVVPRERAHLGTSTTVHAVPRPVPLEAQPVPWWLQVHHLVFPTCTCLLRSDQPEAVRRWLLHRVSETIRLEHLP